MDTIEMIFGIANTLIIFIGAVVVLYQLNLMRKSNTAQAYATIFEILQKEEVREARKMILSASEPIDFHDQTLKEAAKLVASTYDCVGRLLDKKVVPYEYVTEGAHDSIIKCWRRIKLLTEAYRKENVRGNDYWEGFLNLYNKAERYENIITGKVKPHFWEYYKYHRIIQSRS